jgi:hypothetical protein
MISRLSLHDPRRFEIDSEAGTYSYRGVQLAGAALPGYSKRRDAAIELMGYRATEPRDADKLLRAVGGDLYAEEAKENYQRINLMSSSSKSAGETLGPRTMLVKPVIYTRRCDVLTLPMCSG